MNNKANISTAAIKVNVHVIKTNDKVMMPRLVNNILNLSGSYSPRTCANTNHLFGKYFGACRGAVN
jgi:hypothetical protein